MRTSPPQQDEAPEVDDAGIDEISQNRPEEKPQDQASEAGQAKGLDVLKPSNRRKAGKQLVALGFGRQQKNSGDR